MRWFLRVGTALLLIFVLSANVLAANPDGSTAATAIPLPASLSASGTLTGLAQGAFAFYTLDYPGDGSVGSITLNVNPTDSNTTNAVGVNLYQAGAMLLSMNALGATSGVNLGKFSSTIRAPVLIQVYNYLPGQEATYHFSVSGISGQGASVGGLSTATSSSPATGTTVGSGGQMAKSAVPLSASLSASGVLTGSPIGSFAYYTFNSPGDGRSGTLTLTINPTNPGTTNAVGVNLYQAGSTLLSMNATSSVPGTNSGAFSSATAGPILVQVYNYMSGQTASYTFAITGTTPVAQASSTQSPSSVPTTSPSTVVVVPSANNGGKTADTALLLPASLSASGSLPGSAVGSFAYYTFNYSGNGRIGTLTLTVNPSDPATTNAVGVHLYQAGTTLLSMNAVSPTPGTNTEAFSSTTAGPILVQVYNYLPGQNASYAFAITGLTP